jgi:hypothetical protein
MEAKEVFVKLPIVKIMRLIGKLIRASKGGLSKEEALDLLEDLSSISFDIAERFDRLP